MKIGGGQAHEKFGIRLTRDRDLLQRSESGFLVRADRRCVVHRWPDHAHVDAVKLERHVA